MTVLSKTIFDRQIPFLKKLRIVKKLLLILKQIQNDRYIEKSR